MCVVQVKFITRATENLAYSDPDKHPKTICSSVIKGCNLPLSVNKQEWWNTIGKRVTREKITTLRNDRVKLFKWEYFGKSCTIAIVLSGHEHD